MGLDEGMNGDRAGYDVAEERKRGTRKVDTADDRRVVRRRGWEKGVGEKARDYDERSGTSADSGSMAAQSRRKWLVEESHVCRGDRWRRKVGRKAEG
jgi:hypothetical protein